MNDRTIRELDEIIRLNPEDVKAYNTSSLSTLSLKVNLLTFR